MTEETNLINVQLLLDQAILAKNSEPRQRSGKFHPSKFGRCFRLQYWARLGEVPTNPPDERTMRVFRAGDLFHDFVQETIISAYPDVKKEVLVEIEDVKGYADIVLSMAVADVKSQHSQAFHYMRRCADITVDKKNNILQLMYYAINLHKEKAVLVFVSKDDLCIQQYVFDVNERWKGELNDELTILRGFWRNQTLPAAQPRAYNGKDCNFCEFLDKCAALEKAAGRELKLKK